VSVEPRETWPNPAVLRRVKGYSPYEDVVGYSRALVVDAAAPRVLVAGLTSVVDGVVTHPRSAYEQLRQALRTGEAVLRDAGTDLAHVVKTRMYVVAPELCDAAGRAHRDVFAEIRPVATMLVVAGLYDRDMLVEVELEATLP
jgi:enamine deaminase RidA (YjgF/YER057c/UK114 family)